MTMMSALHCSKSEAIELFKHGDCMIYIRNTGEMDEVMLLCDKEGIRWSAGQRPQDFEVPSLPVILRPDATYYSHYAIADMLYRVCDDLDEALAYADGHDSVLCIWGDISETPCENQPAVDADSLLSLLESSCV